MPVFTSTHPDIKLPTDITIWDWLFDSSHSPLTKYPSSSICGFTNAITKDRVSYIDLKSHTTHLSTALVRKYGLQQGDTVALFSPNSIWYPVAMLGVLRAGGVVSGASPAYNVEEMTYALKTANAKFLMTMPASMDVAIAAAREAGIPRDRIFLLEGEVEGYTTMKELLEVGEGFGDAGQVEAFKLPSGKKNKDVCAFLSFSSGTTGLPKAVMIAHQNVIAQCLQVENLTPTDLRKIVAVLPLFHITGLVHQLHLPIYLNAEVYMLPAFTMPALLDTITEYKIEEVLLVPPILIRLVRDPLVNKYDLSFLKRFSTGAAPVSPEILQLLQQKFPHTGFKQGYGMTESCSCITAHPQTHYDYKYASRVGQIVANTSVKIIDPDTGAEQPLGKPGEILAKGPQVVMGYLNNEKATRETFDSDGYLHTGDMGVLDSEGFITITDRIKEMIKVKAIQVAPAELEDLLLGHPLVEDAAVLAIEDAYSGERPKAFVVLKPGQEAEWKGREEEVARGIIAFVKEKKVRHKWVKEVELVEAIPKSPSGKILRRVLRGMQRDGRENSVVVREVEREAKL